jgi:hypothetical protein
MPFEPVGQLVILDFLVNVPFAATPLSQEDVHELADISVAKHLILFKRSHQKNIWS